MIKEEPKSKEEGGSGLNVIGKIDLSEIDTRTRPEKKKKEAKPTSSKKQEAKPAPKTKPAPAAKTEKTKKEEPKKEEPKKEPKKVDLISVSRTRSEERRVGKECRSGWRRDK